MIALPPPGVLAAASMRAASAQPALHYVARSDAITMVCDVARNRGVQHITLRYEQRTGHATIVLVHKVAYVRGDAFMLATYLQFPRAGARRYAGRWIRVAPGDKDYAEIANGLTVATTIRQIELSGRIRRAPVSTRGRARVVQIRGTVTNRGSTLPAIAYLAVRAPHLPIRVIELAGGHRTVVDLGRWHEHVRVAAPRTAVPLARVITPSATA